MRIAINLFGESVNKAGTGWFAYSVVRELMTVDKRNDYFVFAPKGYENVFDILKDLSSSNFHVISLLCPSKMIFRRLYEQLILPFVILRYRCKKVFSTNSVCPILLGRKECFGATRYGEVGRLYGF